MENIVAVKSYAFAIRIVKLYKLLLQEKKEFVLSKQMLRSGTAIGALIREAEHAQSKADFLNKMNVALKEANETEYWLILMKDTEYLNEAEFQSIKKDCSEILKLLISIVKSTKTTLKK
ncbi:four helix bundle protein [Pedobacter sp. UBA4863]|uniref:four helix bundle protein n=1 Tax=Pedobacter sp. UBA4863 TaxID=1947060 RepID=UPI0025F3194C|nr:four helix bundle protein [Pedobacter sp. UBA4863]